MAETTRPVSPIEFITDPARIKEAPPPLLTVFTGQTNGEHYYLKINQPEGRAIMIALHL